MKIRIAKNQLRIRIDQSQLMDIATEKSLETKIVMDLLGNKMVFSIRPVLNSKEVVLVKKGDWIMIEVPKDLIIEQLDNPHFQIVSEMEVLNHEPLQVIIEKDLPKKKR